MEGVAPMATKAMVRQPTHARTLRRALHFRAVIDVRLNSCNKRFHHTKEGEVQSSSRSDVDPFIVMDVMEAARRAEAAGQHVIHMEVGQPGTPAPKGALAALSGVLHGEPLGYTVALGLPELRARIAALYKNWYDVDLSPNRVIVTSGSSAAFLLAFSIHAGADACSLISIPSRKKSLFLPRSLNWDYPMIAKLPRLIRSLPS